MNMALERLQSPQQEKQSQLYRQFWQVGYRPGDDVYLRLIAPKKMPLDEQVRRGLAFVNNEGKTVRISIDLVVTMGERSSHSFERLTRLKRNPETKQFEPSNTWTSNGFKLISDWNQQGYGVYFVVNPGGREDQDIQECRTLFYECDSVSKDEQWERLNSLEADLSACASLIVETRKSLHCYFKLDQPLPPDEWQEFQQRLIQRQDSDPAICNPARLMRAAGFNHQAWNSETRQIESTPVQIAEAIETTDGQQVELDIELFDIALPWWDGARWKKTGSDEGDRPPVDPDGNPFDLRNFASYLEGYNPNGRRRGVITCKCPAHNGESDDSLHIFEDTGAFKCHSGCDPKTVYAAALEVAKASGYTIPKNFQSGRSSASVLPSYELTFAPDRVVSTRYLEELNIPAGEKLVVVKAPYGCGKSYSIALEVQSAIRNGQRVLVITYRQQLAIQLSKNFGVPYKSQVWETPGGEITGYCLCIDSLHPKAEVPFTADGTQNDLVIIDEVVAVVWHLLNSDTLAGDKQRSQIRPVVLHHLQKLLEGVLAPSTRGRVILADGDMSDLEINFIRKLGGQPELKPYLITSDYQHEQRGDLFNYDDAPSLLTALTDAIASGGKHMVFTSGQKSNSTWGTQTLEAYLAARFPDKTIGRIDSATVANPEHSAFRCMGGNTKDDTEDSIDRYIENFDVVIASPVIESGVSIELFGHFSGVWCFAMGVTTESAVRQILARVRDNAVPRHLYAPGRAINGFFLGSGETNPKALIETEKRKAQAHIRFLKDFALTIDEDGNVSANPASLVPLQTWGQVASRVNKGLSRYRESILSGLKKSGHSIKDGLVKLSVEASKSVRAMMKDIAEGRHKAEAQAIAKALPLQSEQEYEVLKKRKEKTTADYHQQRKYELAQRYGLEVDESLVLKDDDGWNTPLKTHYYCTIGSPFLQARDAKNYQSISDENGRAFIPDIPKRCISARVMILIALQVPRLLGEMESGAEFSSNHPTIEAIAKLVRQYPTEVKDHLGIQPTASSSNITVVQDVLNAALGFRLEFIGQRGSKKDRVRLYKYTPPQDGRFEVFQAWLKRDQEVAERAAERAATVAGLLGLNTSTEERHAKKTREKPNKDLRGFACSSAITTVTPSVAVPASEHQPIDPSTVEWEDDPPSVTADSAPVPAPSTPPPGWVPQVGELVRMVNSPIQWVIALVGTATARLRSPGGLEMIADFSEICPVMA